MAQKINVILVDDIDGSGADETVPFGLDGTQYEIDLNSGHAEELRERLDLYVRKARKVTGPAGRAGRGRRTGANDARNKEIRNWARGSTWMSTSAVASQPTSWRSSRRQTANSRHR
jgi:hypothetical protein